MRYQFFDALNTVVLVLGRGPVLKMASLFGAGAFLSSFRMSPTTGGRVHVGDEGCLNMDMPAVLLVGGRGPHLFICVTYAPLLFLFFARTLYTASSLSSAVPRIALRRRALYFFPTLIFLFLALLWGY